MAIENQVFWNYSKRKVLYVFALLRLKVKYHKNFKNIRKGHKIQQNCIIKGHQNKLWRVLWVLFWHLLVQSQQQKHFKVKQFKVINKDIKATSMTLLVTLNRFRMLRCCFDFWLRIINSIWGFYVHLTQGVESRK